MRALPFLVIAMMAVASGCATSTNSVCLKLPVSSKLSNQDVASCAAEATADLSRRDVFDRYVRLLWARGAHQKMVAICRKVLQLDGKRLEARFYLAVAQRRLGHCQEAIKNYELYAAARKDDADPHFGLALCHENLGQPGQAVAAFRRFVKLAKRDDQTSWRARAKERIAALAATMNGGGVAASSASVTPAVKARPAVPSTARAARASKPTPTPVAAKKAPPRPRDCSVYVAAIKNDPFATKAYEAHARCELSRGGYEAVIKRMRIAIRDNPEFNRGWLFLARAYKATHKTALAKSAYAKACTAGISAGCKSQ